MVSERNAFVRITAAIILAAREVNNAAEDEHHTDRAERAVSLAETLADELASRGHGDL